MDALQTKFKSNIRNLVYAIQPDIRKKGNFAIVFKEEKDKRLVVDERIKIGDQYKSINTKLAQLRLISFQIFPNFLLYILRDSIQKHNCIYV